MVDSNERRRYLGLCAASASAALAGCGGLLSLGADEQNSTEQDDGTDSDADSDTDDDADTDDTDDPEKVDDWQYSPSRVEADGAKASGAVQASAAPTSGASGGGDGGVGLSAGGAKDISTFRRNIEEGNLPLPESLSYEGLFYDYYFERGGSGSCSSLFCPRYAPAVTPDPLSDETERYLTVGLDSGLSQSEFERKQLNLVVVLDISGSMGSSFDEYYYDRYGNRKEVEGDTSREKIAVARDALVALTEQLEPGDRLGVVLFDNDSTVAKPMRDVETTDMEAIRDHIQEDIEPRGGTNIASGIDEATELLEEYTDADPTVYENRTVLLTDAMPNIGETSAGGLRETLESNAEKGLHTTVVGVGLDFNTDLVDQITAIRGSNYYSVHSADEFERRLGEEFEYMVTPLVYDLSLELDADGYDIKQVYGSTAAEEATGELMAVNTLFPSPTKDGKAKGGVVLVQVERQSDDATMRLRADWETREGISQVSEETITFPAGEDEQFAHSGVRKAVLLSRYADLLKTWMIAEHEGDTVREDTDDGDIVRSEEADSEGIPVPPEYETGKWERSSQALTVSARQRDRIEQFRDHFATESEAIGDDSLETELETLDAILDGA